MNNIEKLHEEVFNYLTEWSENARRNNNINPYFYMRSVRDERFEKGYWFPGDENALYISFWSGGDSSSKAPNIYFDISKKYGCRLVLVSKDSESKYQYLNKLFNQLIKLSQNKNLYFKAYNNYQELVINFKSDYYKWEQTLASFITKEKIEIDNYIKANAVENLEEFVSNIGFISAKKFDELYSRVLKERNLIQKNNKQYEFNKKPKLPFALLSISIENFLGIKVTSIDELRPDAKWIFVTGENGYGKTSLLQAIALGLSDDPDLEKYLETKTRISIELVHQNEKTFPVRTKGNISKLESYDYGQFILGYGPARLNVQSKTSENVEDKSTNNVLSLFDNEALLKNINYELFASSHSDRTTFYELEELIKKVTKGRISQIKIKEREALFVETLSNGDLLEPMPLSKLAAGFRSIINIVIDIYLRFKKIHLNKKYIDFYGIVLIDEIENHLHPILQRELPITLSQVFPNIQFIISTHSPIPLLGADKNSLILKVNRTKEDGITVEHIKIDNILALTPNILFTSPVFGFSDIINDNLINKQYLRTEDTWAEMINTDKLDQTLTEMYNKRKNI